MTAREQCLQLLRARAALRAATMSNAPDPPWYARWQSEDNETLRALQFETRSWAEDGPV